MICQIKLHVGTVVIQTYLDDESIADSRAQFMGTIGGEFDKQIIRARKEWEAQTKNKKRKRKA